jgi:hypothetical protein
MVRATRGGREKRPGKLFVCSLVVLLVSCDPLEPDTSVGVSITADGSLDVYLSLCGGEILRSVRLLDAHDGIVGDENDVVLWGIAPEQVGAVRSEEQLVLPVGNIPTGFRELSALSAPLPEGKLLTVTMKTDRRSQLVGFRISNLVRGSVLSAGDTLGPEEFVERAQEGCSQAST